MLSTYHIHVYSFTRLVSIRLIVATMFTDLEQGHMIWPSVFADQAASTMTDTNALYSNP